MLQKGIKMQRKLKQSFIRKAKEPVFANDDMIYQVDIHCICRFTNMFCQCFVRLTRTDIP